MDNTPSSSEGNKTRPTLTFEAVSTILWESVWNSLIRAFLIQILGGIAISFLGDVFGEMAPSLPPVPGLKPEADAPHAPGFPALKAFIVGNEFWIIFAVVLALTTATRFADYLQSDKHRRVAALLLRIHRRLSSHWFSLIVVNAFTAWILSAIFVLVQQFSWTQIVLGFVGQILAPVLHLLSSIVPGSGWIGRWASWFSENQPKFYFWLFYSAAICEDLGLPNYKAWMRWGSRRVKCYVRSRLGLSPGAPVPEAVRVESRKGSGLG